MASFLWLDASAPIALGDVRPPVEDDNASFATHDMVGLPQMSEGDTARILEQAQSHTFYIFRTTNLRSKVGPRRLSAFPPGVW